MSRVFFLGCVGLLWGQTATAWYWHAAADSGKAEPVKSLGTLKQAWVRVQADTVYLMGTYYQGSGGSSADFKLPTTGTWTPPLPASSTGKVATYLAAYNRRSGRLAWVMRFYRSNRDTWGTDLVVDATGTVYLLLVSYLENIDWEYRDSTGVDRTGSLNSPTSLPTNKCSFIVKVGPRLGSPPVVTHTVAYSLASSSWVELRHLLLVRDTLYAAGSLFQGILGSASFGIGSFSFSLSISSIVGPYPEQAFIAGLRASTLDAFSAGRVIAYQSVFPLRNFYNVRGHALIWNPATSQVVWLVETRGSSDTLEYSNVGGGASSTALKPGLWAVTLPSTLSSTSVQFNWLSWTDSLSESPFLYLRGDTLLWAIADGRRYEVQGTPGAFSTADGDSRILLVEQKLGSSSTAVVRYWESPRIQGGVRLFDLAVEREGQFVYLAGQAQATTWGPLLHNLPLAQTSILSAGYLLGLRRQSSAYGVLGYRRFYALSRYTGLLAMAYDPSRAQFYLVGGWKDSLVVHPRWPDGDRDTLTLDPGITDNPRLWLGRLDWYRLETPATLTACLPDTLSPGFSLTWTGTSTGEDTVFVWMADSLALRYYPHQRIAFRPGLIVSWPAALEGRHTGTAPLYALGRYPPGRYFLTQRVKALPARWADVIDTLWLGVTGTTLPELGRSGVYRDSRIVVPFVGYPQASAQASTRSVPFYRRDSVNFSSITDLVYFPWEAGRERLYLFEPRYLYEVDLTTGLVRRTGPLPPAAQLLPDRTRGRLYFRSELDFFTSPNLLNPLLQRNLGTSSYLITQSYGGYPLRYDSTWVFRIVRATFLPNGDLVFVAEERPGGGWRGSLFRVSFAYDSVWRVTKRPSPGDCPQDGVGDGALIASAHISTLAVEADTIYWIERIPGSCSGGDTTWLLRRAFPRGADPRVYQVETIDTLWRVSSYDPGQLLYAAEPERSLLFVMGAVGQSRLMRYRLTNRQADTLLWQLGRFLGCPYGAAAGIDNLSRYTLFALLRGGALVFTNGVDVRIALPAYSTNMRDTLRAEGSVGSATAPASWGAAFSGQQVEVLPPSPGSGGEDSTRLTVSVSGCSAGKSFYYGCYRLSSPVQLWLQAPDAVCEGMVFHSLVGRDTEYVVYGCRVTHRLVSFSATGPLLGINMGNEVVRWKATGPGAALLSANTVRAFQWLVGPGLSHSLQVKRGHRLRLRILLEGPYQSSGPALLRVHPFLTRYNFAFYHQRTLPVSRDSLWRLPFTLGDSLAKAWHLLLVEPSGPCSGAGPWWCQPNWTGLALVELRESPGGLVVDSAYALVDSMGRLYFWHAPAGDIGLHISNADTLHFCRCNPTTPKYLTVRFPGHLPLHTPALTLGSLGTGQADSLDLTDPSSLEGIPGQHYTLLWDGGAGRMRAAAWAGNCADLHNAFMPGPHFDAGHINAADYEFYLPRNGVTTGFSWADLDSDGDVDAADGLLLIVNQNALRESSRP